MSLLATIVATALSYALPDSQAATGVGLVFLVFTYLLVLRDADASTVKESGLSLGGLFEPEPLSPARRARSALTALGWAFAFALVLFPPFWLGFVAWHAPTAHFAPASLLVLGRDVLGQVFGVAFPEEVFFRGYLQSALDRAWPPRFKVFGAPLGPSLLVASAIFALGHLSTDPAPPRASPSSSHRSCSASCMHARAASALPSRSTRSATCSPRSWAAATVSTRERRARGNEVPRHTRLRQPSALQAAAAVAPRAY